MFDNDGGNRNHRLNVRLIATKTNRSPIGAVARIQSACGQPWNMVRSGSSYCPRSDPALAFDVGYATKVTGLQVEWLVVQHRLTDISANQFLKLEEAK